jgi:hypothetical protein
VIVDCADDERRRKKIEQRQNQLIIPYHRLQAGRCHDQNRCAGMLSFLRRPMEPTSLTAPPKAIRWAFHYGDFERAEREATVDCIARPKRRAEDAGCGEREVGALQLEGSPPEKPLIR